MKDTSIATLQVGPFSVARWPEIKRWLMMDDAPEPVPGFLGRLGAADLFAFSNGQQRTKYVVSTDEQRQLLMTLGLSTLDIILRTELESSLRQRGEVTELDVLPLLGVLKLALQVIS